MNELSYSGQEWAALHKAVQQRFRALAAEIPSAQAEFGKTVTGRFPLFSHVSFSATTRDDGNDIIVGVDIAPQDGQWRIDADICNEEEGTIYFELPNPPFSVSSFDELRERVLATTDELVARGKSVLLRLIGPPTPVLTSQAASFPQVAPKA